MGRGSVEHRNQATISHKLKKKRRLRTRKGMESWKFAEAWIHVAGAETCRWRLARGDGGSSPASGGGGLSPAADGGIHVAGAETHRWQPTIGDGGSSLASGGGGLSPAADGR